MSTKKVGLNPTFLLFYDIINNKLDYYYFNFIIIKNINK